MENNTPQKPEQRINILSYLIVAVVFLSIGVFVGILAQDYATNKKDSSNQKIDLMLPVGENPNKRYPGITQIPDGTGGGAFCQADAMICPDGSSVGRMPPNCEFAPCPSGESKNMGITPAVTNEGISIEGETGSGIAPPATLETR